MPTGRSAVAAAAWAAAAAWYTDACSVPSLGVSPCFDLAAPTEDLSRCDARPARWLPKSSARSKAAAEAVFFLSFYLKCETV